MGKESISTVSFLQELFQFGVYKRNQGRVARQVTFATLAMTFALAAWRLYVTLITDTLSMRYSVAGAVLLLGLWFSYRIVNFPRFADFLVAVEAEMNKVSWPTRGELLRASLVVIFVIISLAALLFLFDFLWRTLFVWLEIVKM